VVDFFLSDNEAGLVAVSSNSFRGLGLEVPDMRPREYLSLTLRRALTLAPPAAVLLSALAPCSYAGWCPDKQITYTTGRSGLSPSNAKCVAFDSSGMVHAVWHDDTPGNYEIMYLRFDTLTAFPAEPRRITWNSGVSRDPAIALLSDSSVFVTWTEDSDGPVTTIDFARFLPDSSFLADSGGVSVPLYACTNASVAAGPDTSAHVVWIQKTGLTYSVFYRKWHFGWVGEPVNVSASTGICSNPCVCVDALGRVHTAWSDNVSGNNEVYYRGFSEPGGWGDVTRVSFSYAIAWSPSLAADANGDVFVVWSDKRHGYFDIYFRRYLRGVGWGNEKRVTHDSAVSANPSAAVDCDGNLHIVWEDYRDGNEEIYYRRVTDSDGPGWDPTDTRLTDDIYTSWDASVVADCAGNAHVLWADNRTSNFEIYYKLGIAPVPVDVELLDFHAECKAEGVLLQWQTVSDGPPALFDIFREENQGGALRKLTDEPLHGSTQYLDASAEAGKTYLYYLGVWEGGAVNETMFGPLVVAFAPPAAPVTEALAVWPNPSRGFLNITFFARQPGTGYSLALYDVRGRLVTELASGRASGAASTLTWEAPRGVRSQLCPGIYFVVMESDGKRSEKKVLLLGDDAR